MIYCFVRDVTMCFVTMVIVSATLTQHTARKFVMDFLRMIVVDSLSLPQTGKQAPVIDLLLEVSTVCSLLCHISR